MKNKISIIDFGAKSNELLQTQAIQNAIDTCFLQGGGEVIVPEGTYLTGSIRLRSNVTLHLLKNAVLKGVRNPLEYFTYLDDKIEPLSPSQITDAGYVGLWTIHGETKYDENDSRYRFKRIPGSRWNNALIRIIDAENVSIIGDEGSIIDGDNCYDEIGEEEYRGPHAIAFFNVKNIRLSGYTVKNSGNWAHHLLFSKDILVENIKVEAGHDGFDASVCTNLKIINSEFYTGDDCIAGFGNENVLISNCILNSSCSAFRLGGTNVHIKDSKCFAPGKYSFRGKLSKQEKIDGVMATPDNSRNNMLSFFTYYADYSVPIPKEPKNILIENVEIIGADKLLHYNFSGNETWQRYRPLKDITFKNVKVYEISAPSIVYGTENEKIKFKLENVYIKASKNSNLKELFKVCNYEEISITNLKIDNFEGESIILSKGGENVNFKNVNSKIKNENYVIYTKDDFKIDWI